MRVLLINCDEDLLDAADLARNLIEDPEFTDKVAFHAKPHNAVLRNNVDREYTVKRTSSGQITIWGNNRTES